MSDEKNYTYLDLLPSEILTEVLVYLDYFELKTLKEIFSIIKTEGFWLTKLYIDYSDVKLNPIPDLYSVRGIISRDRFSIIAENQNEYQQGLIDRRRSKRGKSCNSTGKFELTRIMWYFQLPINIVIHGNIYELL